MSTQEFRPVDLLPYIRSSVCPVLVTTDLIFHLLLTALNCDSCINWACAEYFPRNHGPSKIKGSDFCGTLFSIINPL